jgi:thioesterase domain-containing protein
MPIECILKYPRLGQLAEYIAKRENPLVRKHDAIVFREEGREAPLFLIHDGTGNVTCLLSLSQQLEQGFPIYGVELKDSDSASSVENLVAHHLRTIRAIQPRGPYRLAGYSFGGLAAYEMAYLLLGENEEVSFVGLIDTYTPEALQRVRAHATAAEHPMPAAFQNGQSDLSQLRILSASIEITMRYYLRPINIPVLLFAATDNAVGETASSGWQSLSVCEVRTHSIPGAHRTMIAEPLVGALAQKMSVAIRQGGGGASSVVQSPPRSPGFIIQEHKRSAGVIFCFPGAGAPITCFLPLANSLDTPLDIIGLQPRGLDGKQVPHNTVEAAVTSYLETILKFDPSGPYRLLGHSFGGWLAFETATRLVSMGKRVLPLLLLDTEPPLDRSERLPKYDRKTVLARYLRQFEKHARAGRNGTGRNVNLSSEREQLNKLVDAAESASVISRSILESPIYRSVCVYHANVNTAYRPGSPLDQDIYLFQTADIDPDDPGSIPLEEARNSWRAWAPNLKPVFIEGNHVTMLQRPYIDSVAELAETLWVVESGGGHC